MACRFAYDAREYVCFDHSFGFAGQPTVKFKKKTSSSSTIIIIIIIADYGQSAVIAQQPQRLAMAAEARGERRQG